MPILDMSSKKTISINPNLFSVGGKKGKTKTLKKSKPKPNKNLIKPNTLKKNLLQRIKDHQKEAQKKVKISVDSENKEEDVEKAKEFTNDFNNTLNYLNQLAKDNKNKKREKRQRRKKHLQSTQTAQNTTLQTVNTAKQQALTVNTDLPKSLQSNVAPVTFHNTTVRIPPSPPYGILKNGSKPLYRDWKNKTVKRTKFDSRSESIASQNGGNDNNKTQSVVSNKENTASNNNNITANNIESNQISPQIGGDNNSLSQDSDNTLTRRERLKELQKKLREKTEKKQNDDLLVKTKKRTFRKKYKLGKSKGGSKSVSVLIGNQQTRKKIQKDKQTLKRKSVEEIKTYLRNRGFLKVGSDAPIDVLRQMYESSILTGEIKNTGKGVLVDNYLAEITEKIKNPDKKDDEDETTNELNL